jgi:SpoVK/Ycf46/Vps4 family AAA+-type ATPase
LEKQPCFIFIDEIDCMCLGRGAANESEESRDQKNAFMENLNGFGNKEDQVFIIGCTNRPQDFDDAFNRRFSEKLYIGMPDEAARSYMFKRLFNGERHNLTSNDFAELTKETDITEENLYYSCSDINTICKKAANIPQDEMWNKLSVEEAQALNKLEQTNENQYHIEMEELKAFRRPIALADVMKAIQTFKPSVGKETLTKMEQYTNSIDDT